MVSVSGLVYASLPPCFGVRSGLYRLSWRCRPDGDRCPPGSLVGVILLGLVTLVPSLFGGLKDARAALATPRMRLGFLVTCALLSVNWIVFVYAVQARQVFDAALGYFIYPLVTVILGVLML